MGCKRLSSEKIITNAERCKRRRQKLGAMSREYDAFREWTERHILAKNDPEKNQSA